jgi:ribonuclease HII
MTVRRRRTSDEGERHALLPSLDAPAAQLVVAPPPFPDLAYERLAWSSGFLVVAGVDEVGRGALAGPVVAAAVVLDPDRVPVGLDDSKRLAPKRREELDELVRASALCWRVARVEADEIDRVNILRASLRAMRLALDGLGRVADHVLVDGNVCIPDWPRSQATVIGGDGLSASIAAASIVAKVARDRLMAEYDDVWPGYGFGDHAGYGTRAHRDAIERLGPCPLHRRTFRGVETEDLLDFGPQVD